MRSYWVAIRLMPKSLRAWFMRLFGVFGSGRSERELSDELDAHLQHHIDDNLRAGMSSDEARRRAVLALGGLEQTKERYRDRRGLPLLESWLRDLRYGVRTLLKSPGFALAGVVILGLGIGANAAIFTVVNAVVLRPLPFPDSDRIVRLWHTPPPTLFSEPTFSLSPANFVDWEAQSQSFELMATYRGGRRTVTGHGEPEGIITLRTSASLFQILASRRRSAGPSRQPKIATTRRRPRFSARPTGIPASARTTRSSAARS